MSNDEGFKKKAYLGTAYLVDSQTKQIIASGHGRFDTVDLMLETEFKSTSMGEHQDVVVVLETQDGYFSPAIRVTQTFMIMGTSRRSDRMERCMHWPLARGVDYLLNKYGSISLQLKSKHEPNSWRLIESTDGSELTEELLIKSIRKNLASAKYKNFTVAVNSGFGTSHSHHRVDDESIVRRRVRFKLTHSEGAVFDIDSLFKILQAFKMYWITSHDSVDCEFTRIHLGEDVSLMLHDNKLAAVDKNVEGYYAAIPLDRPLELENLVRIIHFYLNPAGDKALGARSKIGLAMSRIIGHRYDEKHKRIDYRIIDLVFALQGFAEAMAQREISKQNRATKAQTLEAIGKVMAAIAVVEADIPENVRSFYSKDIDAIYASISRPTFSQSIKITAEKLNVDLAPYDQMLSDVEKARQQVVHSENYDPIFLIDLLTQGTTKVEKSKDGKTVSMVIGVKKGSLDHLYDVVVKLLRQYLLTYGA